MREVAAYQWHAYSNDRSGVGEGLRLRRILAFDQSEKDDLDRGFTDCGIRTSALHPRGCSYAESRIGAEGSAGSDAAGEQRSQCADTYSLFSLCREIDYCYFSISNYDCYNEFMEFYL